MTRTERNSTRRTITLVAFVFLIVVVGSILGASTAVATDYTPDELDGETFWIGQEHTVDLSGTAANDGDVVQLREITDRSSGTPTATRLATELSVSDRTVTIRTSRLDEGRYVLRHDGQYLDGTDFTGDLATADSIEVVRQTLTVTIGGDDPTESEVSVGDSLDGSEIIALSRGDIVGSSEANTSHVLFGSNTSVSGIWFAGDDVDGEALILDLAVEPTTTGPSAGRTVSVSSITVPDEVTDWNATIRFTVSTDRLDELAVDASDLRVNRYDTETDAWTDLETTLVDEAQDSVVVEAKTPGFSLFSVSAVDSPDAVISDLPEATHVGTDVTLDASASTDRYGTISRYDWTIDDQNHRGETVTVSFDRPGEYTVELTVTNHANESHTLRETILVEAVDTPEPAISDTPTPTPADDSETEAGDIDPGPDDQAFGFDLVSALLAFGVLVSVMVTRRR